MKNPIKSESSRKVELVLGTIMAGLMILVFSQLIFSGLTSFGDWYFPNPDRIIDAFAWPRVIQDYTQIGFYGGLFAQRYLVEALFTLLVSWGIPHTWLTNLFYLLPGPILAAVGMWRLAKELHGNPFGSFFASLLYTFNTYPLMLFSGGHILISVAYGLVPWIILIARRLLLQPSKLNLFILMTLVSLMSAYDPRIVYVTALSVSVLTLGEFGKQLFTRQRIKWVGYFIFLFLLVNAYWIYPSFMVDSGTSYLASSTDVYWVDTLSYANFWNALTLHHVWWPGVLGLGPQHSPYSFFYFIPFIALVGYIFKRGSGRVWGALFILMLMGAFLTKGSNEPFGELYRWMFQHVFGFNVFRDPSKFFAMIAPAVSLLFGVGVVQIWSWAQVRCQAAVKTTLVMIVATIFIFGYSPVWLGQLGGNFDKHVSSNQVNEKLAELNKQDNWYRVWWLPMHYRFVLFDADHPSIDGNDTLMQKLVWQSIPHLQDWLASFGETTKPNLDYVLKGLGVKYMALAGDPINDLYEVNFLTTQERYKKVINELDIFAGSHDIKDSQGGISNLFIYPETLDLFYPSKALVMLDDKTQFDLLGVDSPATYAVAINDQDERIAPSDASFSVKAGSLEENDDGSMSLKIKNYTGESNVIIGYLPSQFSLLGGTISQGDDLPFAEDPGNLFRAESLTEDGTVPIEYLPNKAENLLNESHIEDWQVCRSYTASDKLATVIEQIPNNLRLTSENGVSACLELIIPNLGDGQFLATVVSEGNQPTANLDIDFVRKGNQVLSLKKGGENRLALSMPSVEYEYIRLRLNVPSAVKGELNISSITFEKFSNVPAVFALSETDNIFAQDAQVDYTKIDAQHYAVNVHTDENRPAILNFSMAYHNGWELVHKATGQVVTKHFSNILNTNTWIIEPELEGEFELGFSPINNIRTISYISLAALMILLGWTISIVIKSKRSAR